MKPAVILVVAFVVSLFNDAVRIYEPDNVGHVYDLGFVLGAAVFLRGTGSIGWKCRSKRKAKDDIGEKIEARVRKGIKSWLDEKGESDPEWKEIATKIETKIKRELRDWADKEED